MLCPLNTGSVVFKKNNFDVKENFDTDKLFKKSNFTSRCHSVPNPNFGVNTENSVSEYNTEYGL